MNQDHHASDGALLNLGKRESGAERLEQAVAAFTEALKERTRERVPPSTGPRRETPAKFRRVDPGERIFHDNGTYRSSFRLMFYPFTATPTSPHGPASEIPAREHGPDPLKDAPERALGVFRTGRVARLNNCQRTHSRDRPFS